MSQYITKERLEELKKELEERKGTIRTDISRRISAAKELGDLSENAEYTEARESQSFNEGRIVELEETIKEAIMIDSDNKPDVVVVGSTVKVKFNGSDQKFTIVGPAESDPAKGFISNESPLGSAFLGHHKGDEVEARIPSGLVKYKIIEIS